MARTPKSLTMPDPTEAEGTSPEDALKEAMSEFADHSSQALRDAAAGDAGSAAINQHHAQVACDRATDLLSDIIEGETK